MRIIIFIFFSSEDSYKYKLFFSFDKTKFTLVNYKLFNFLRKQTYTSKVNICNALKGAKDSWAVSYVRICCILKRKQLLAENIKGIMLQDQETVIVVVVIYRPSIYPSKYLLQNLQTVLIRECYTKLQKNYNYGWF